LFLISKETKRIIICLSFFSSFSLFSIAVEKKQTIITAASSKQKKLHRNIMKAASLAINTDTFSQPIKNELFPVDENSTCTSATDDHGPEVPLSILSSMPSYGNSDDPMNLDSSACWNMPEDLDMSSLLDASLWSFDSSTQQSPSNNLQHPLEGDSCKTNSGLGTFQTPTNDPSWLNGQFHIPPTPSYSLPSTRPQSPISNVSSDASNNNSSNSNSNNNSNNMTNQLFPPTPPVESQPMFFGNLGGIQAPIPLNMHNQFPQQRQQPQQCLMSSPFDTQPTPAISHSVPPFSQRSTIPQNKLTQRRRSDQSPYRKNSSTSSTPGVRRRASSVASVVSLTAHEPIAHFVDGIEHITFLYSHDRLIKEYTVRTDVNNLNLDDVPMEFRLQNAVSQKKKKKCMNRCIETPPFFFLDLSPSQCGKRRL
jgi:hypothetical protein